MNRCWYCYFGEAAFPEFKEIDSILTQEGLRLYKVDTDPPKETGIVFFSAVTEPLIEYLHRFGLNRTQRILAVAVGSFTLSESSASNLIRSGASDAFKWKHPKSSAKHIIGRIKRWTKVDNLLASPQEVTLIGENPIWKSIIRQIIEVAYFTDLSILITGETGTGKELVAHLIHNLDPRRKKNKFEVLDCTTIVPELSGSELLRT